MKFFNLEHFTKRLSGYTGYFSINHTDSSTLLYDRTLLWTILILLCIGLVMVASASVSVGVNIAHDPLMFAKRDALYILLSIFLSLITLRIPIHFWQRYSPILLLFTIGLLILVLFIGRETNGAARWIIIGPLRIQPAELSKLAFFCYLSGYLVRKVNEVRSSFWGFCKPMTVMIIFAVLLLAQPDLGTVIVLFITTLGVLFLAGAKLWQFIAIILSGFVSVALLIIAEPYRIKRVTSFLRPWDDPFGAGYQLIQSLMAYGRGEFLGQGLGNSIQKLSYLPEPHTDFIFAVIGEELGFIGAMIILVMIFFISFRAMMIGKKALQLEQRFAGFLACAIGIWFSFQTLVNIGAATGILPTKGLTLPFISYGGSSLFVMSTAIVILLRIDHESRLAQAQAHIRNQKRDPV